MQKPWKKIQLSFIKPDIKEIFGNVKAMLFFSLNIFSFGDNYFKKMLFVNM